MKVKYLGETSFLEFTCGKVYEVISVEKDWYRIVDESGDDYLYPPELFEIMEPNDGSTPVLNSSLSSEQVSIIRAKGSGFGDRGDWL